MINFSLGEYLFGLLISAIFGILFSILHTIILNTPYSLENIFKSFKLLMQNKRELYGKLHQIYLNTGKKENIISVRNEILNFIFITMCGLLYTVLLYITFDGIFRALTLVVVLVFYFIASKSLSPKSKALINKILLVINFIVIYTLNLVLKPILLTLKKIIVKTVIRIYKNNNLAKRLKTEKSVQNKKYREISELFMTSKSTRP
jgi:hypothetical protein